jgi:cardiolipin synthase
MRGLNRTQNLVLLIGVTLLGLAHASCARVQSHYVLPQLAVSDRAFLPTVEAYTSTVLDGNIVELLLNGDEIFPAALDAIRSARETITYAQYFYEEGAIGLEVAEALAERAVPESASISRWTASAPS